MANLHSRSNSLPGEPHPLMNEVEDHLCRLKSSTETSTSANSICASLAGLKDLHESISNLIQMPSTKEALSNEEGENLRNELVEGSLRLVDLCGISRDIVCLTKESIQELESSNRRKSDDISAYVASRKKINKMVIKNLKSFNHKSTTIPCEVKAIGTMLKETEALDLSVLKSVLMLVSGAKGKSKQRNWSLLSKFAQTSRRVHSEVEQESDSDDLCFLRKGIDGINLKQLKASEMTIREIEEGLEALFGSLVKTRVSLLNVLCY